VREHARLELACKQWARGRRGVSGVRARAVGRAGGDDGGGGGGNARIELMTKPSPESFQWMYSLQASSCRMFHSVSSQTVIVAGGERRRRRRRRRERGGGGPGLRREGRRRRRACRRRLLESGGGGNGRAEWKEVRGEFMSHSRFGGSRLSSLPPAGGYAL
jgi:hypothetical protein